jgi:hypothetical protein
VASDVGAVGSISDLKRITSVALVGRAKAEAKAKASTRAKWRALPSARSSTLKKYLTPPALSETPVGVEKVFLGNFNSEIRS